MASHDESFGQHGTLDVENFAGISKVSLSVSPFTVIIGPQSVGKSITAKLLHFFKGLPWELAQAASPRANTTLHDRLLGKLLRLLPDPTSGSGPCQAVFRIGDIRLRIHKGGSKGGEWKIEMPAVLRDAHAELKAALAEIRDESDPQDEDVLTRNWDLEEAAHDAFWSKVSNVFPSAASTPRFIPAGRSFYSQIERDMAAYFESASLDPFVSEFGKLLARLKGRKMRSLARARSHVHSNELAGSLVDQLLSGRYVREGLDDYIHVSDGRKLPAKLWSSGQQEVQPLAFILQRYCEGTFRARTLFIEEPEAHLFPSSQKVVTELISLAFNTEPGSLAVFITTHSPYILSTLNNLILAGEKYKTRSTRLKQELQQHVPIELAITPGSIGAFYMDRDGCRSIIDNDTGLIDAAAIDEVSGDIARQFDAILDLGS